MLTNIWVAVSIILLSLYIRAYIRGLYSGAGHAHLYI